MIRRRTEACRLLSASSTCRRAGARDKVLPSGPVLYRQGMIFGVELTLLPIVLAGIEWVVRVIGAMVR